MVLSVVILCSGLATGWGEEPMQRQPAPPAKKRQGAVTPSKKDRAARKQTPAETQKNAKHKTPSASPSVPGASEEASSKTVEAGSSTAGVSDAAGKAPTGAAMPPTDAGTTTKDPASAPAGAAEGSDDGEVRFAVNAYVVEGNSLLTAEQVETTLAKYKGANLRVADIEAARTTLEKQYHDLGYPTVLVFIPEQSIESGTVQLKVVESRIGSVNVVGNEWYPSSQVLGKLPSFQPGGLLYEPKVVKELDMVNVNPDLQVAPVLKAGVEQGTVDVDLKVKDRLPAHWTLSADNRGPFTTPRNRLTASVQYANLWNRDHILTLQTGQTPENWGAVQSYGFSYVAPIIWPDHLLAVYGSLVESNSVLAGSSLPVSAGDIAVAGNAKVFGMRYLFPIAKGGKTTHQVSVGVDYKRLEKTTATFPAGLGTAVVLSPIQYTPVSLGYTGTRPDEQGQTKLGASVRGYVAGAFPGGAKEDFAGDPNDPINKPGNRAGSTGNFAVLQANAERVQVLPNDFRLLLQFDSQWASEPLIPAEQFFAGGLDTVRGYVQNETLGDHAVRARLELLSPAVTLAFDRVYKPRFKTEVQAAVFYDAAVLWVRNAQPGQTSQYQLEGTGFGLRARILDNLSLRLDQAWALRQTAQTGKFDSFLHFSLEMGF